MVEWWRIVVAVICLVLSGLFSGLTLGLFALDLTDLKILLDSGSPTEVKCAKKVYPLRKKGNLLLCTLLIGNTAVNSALAIVTAELFGGISGFLASTFLILYLGEIVPQSVCHKYGLIIGAYASPLVYLMLVLTFPLAWPTAKILDWFLGGESPVRYDKKQLTSLLNLHGSTATAPLSKDETRILRGALEFSQKRIEQVMTPLSQVFMIEVHQPLNFQNLMLVFQSGHSRIPVYEKNRRNIIGVLFAKDVLLIDPEDNLPVMTVLNFFKRELTYVFNDTQLDKMLAEFQTGRGHLAVVKKVVSTSTSDPYYDTVGIVTLEDVIEELIGSEIVDETDVYESNHATRKMKRHRYIDEDVLRLFSSHQVPAISLQENEILAVCSFLSSHVEEFSSRKIPPVVLKEMLREAAILEYKEPPVDDTASHHESLSYKQEVGSADIAGDEPNYHSLDVSALGILGEDEYDKSSLIIYKRNVPAQEATLIITGRLEVVAGSDGIHSEVGPWTLLATKALVNDLYAPDFTARVVDYPVRMLKITRKLYRHTVSRVQNSSLENRSIIVAPISQGLDATMPFRGMQPSSRRNSMESATPSVDGDTLDP